MIESTITAKGQTTVPAEIRKRVQAGPGTRLVWTVMPDGSIVVREKTKSLLIFDQRAARLQGAHLLK
ncbi:type II toxin-antitoxin system PrlF family antitoxin [Burkholderiaceae bacterium UC74_6]